MPNWENTLFVYRHDGRRSDAKSGNYRLQWGSGLLKDNTNRVNACIYGEKHDKKLDLTIFVCKVWIWLVLTESEWD